MAHFLIGLPPSTVIVIDNHTKQFQCLLVWNVVSVTTQILYTIEE